MKKFMVVLQLLLFIVPTAAYAQSTTYYTSWAANSLSGTNENHIPQNTYNMYVTPAGVVYTASGYEEGSYSEIALDTNGNFIGTTGGQFGGLAVAVDSSNQWANVFNNTANEDVLTRYPLGSGGSLGGAGSSNGNSYTWGDTATEGLDIRGMAINGGELYICDIINNEILAFNTTTLHTDRSWTVSYPPGAITIDSSGDLWVVQRAPANSNATADPTGVAIHCYTPGSGSTPGTEITSREITGISPTALAYDPVHNRLLVADNGVDQQVLAYTNLSSTPTLDTTFFNAGTFGYYGGVYSGSTPGLINDPTAGGYLRFHALTGIGVDSSGNIYVALNGCYDTETTADPSPFLSNLYGATDIRKFNTNGQMLWQKYGNGYTQAASIDPGTNGSDLLTLREHYSLDLTKSPGHEATYTSYTVGRFNSPYTVDPFRSAGAGGGEDSFVVRLSGQKFLIVGGSSIYRQSGELWYPCGYIYRTNQYTPQNALYGTNNFQRVMWYDANGDGVVQNSEMTDLGSSDQAEKPMIDSKGNWWVTGPAATGGLPVIHKYTFEGLDSNGTPTWNTGTNVTVPPMFVDTSGNEADMSEELYYDATNDVMYIAGYTSSYPDNDGGYGLRVLSRFNSWSTGNTTPTYTIVLPSDTLGYSSTTRIDSFDVAGGYIFAQSGNSDVNVYSAATGSSVMVMSPGSDVGGYTGANDNFIKVHAFARSNGEILVACEENLYNKVIYYRWNPGGVTGPDNPTGLSATAGNLSVSLSWTPPSGTVTSYNVYRGTSSGSETWLASTTGSVTTYTDATVANGTAYYYYVTAVNAPAESGQSSEVHATPAAGTVDYQINCGGTAESPFVADEYYSSGAHVTTVTNTVTTGLVANPAPEAVYQSERWGAVTYTIPGLTANASYTVRLHMSEYTDPGVGQREFNVAINGVTVMNNYDIYAHAGSLFNAVENSFTTTANSSGQIVIAFTVGAADQPVISGIEIVSGAQPVAASPTFGPVAGTYTSAQSVTLSDSTIGATIYYTTNGTTPSISSTVYTGPISVSSSETIKAIAIANGYTNSSVASAAYTINSTVVYQINCGGPAESPFVADEFYSGSVHTTTITNTVGTNLVANPAPEAVYQSERWGAMTYTIPGLTPGASYSVRLHMSEFTDNGVGQREFNVAINGTSVLSNYDIFSVTGALYRAVENVFTTTANSSGQIVISFTVGAADQPVISGIEILD